MASTVVVYYTRSGATIGTKLNGLHRNNLNHNQVVAGDDPFRFLSKTWE